MQIKNFKNSNDAVVGVVVAILLIGLIVCVVSIIQTQYIPKWMEQTEAEHMDEVADQFAQMKSAIDTQGVIGSNQPTQHTSISTISTGITLGSREFPFLMSTRAFGSLNILPDTSFIVVITDHNGRTSINKSATIQYSSSNAYFLDQSYIYEAGAVILSQDDGDIILTKPTFSVIRENTANISFTIINISKVGEKGSINGYGTYPIQTEYSSNESSIINNVATITIYTKYPNAWSLFINGTLINGGLEYGNDYTMDSSINEGKVIVTFTNPSLPVNLNLQVIKIATQIAPGWVENTKG
jgi:hypothetical protein